MRRVRLDQVCELGQDPTRFVGVISIFVVAPTVLLRVLLRFDTEAPVLG